MCDYNEIITYKLKMESPGFINYTYIVVNKNTRKCVIIDPSWEINKIIDLIDDKRLFPYAILLTHSHYDHTNLVNQLITLYNNIKVFISDVEASFYNFNAKNLYAIPDHTILQMDDVSIYCYITSGHTKGSMIYNIGNNIYTGDTIFTEGCGMCNSKGGSSREMFHSVQFLKKFSDTNIIWPGHAFVYEPGQPLSYIFKENIYFVIEDENLFVKFSERRNNKNIFRFI